MLVHAGASGVGTAAIQLIKHVFNAVAFATAGSDDKCQMCLSLGASAAINYKTTSDFDQQILSITNGLELASALIILFTH